MCPNIWVATPDVVILLTAGCWCVMDWSIRWGGCWFWFNKGVASPLLTPESAGIGMLCTVINCWDDGLLMLLLLVMLLILLLLLLLLLFFIVVSFVSLLFLWDSSMGIESFLSDGVTLLVVEETKLTVNLVLYGSVWYFGSDLLPPNSGRYWSSLSSDFTLLFCVELLLFTETVSRLPPLPPPKPTSLVWKSSCEDTASDCWWICLLW